MEEEFDEEEVWATLMEKEDCPNNRGKKDASFSSHFGSAHTSAPMNIPKRSKSYKARSSLSIYFEEGGSAGSAEDDEEDDEEEERIPPHELLARKMAKSQISSSSVCEGAGRTLKGRDQRKVRDAVLTKTGFLE